uniref:Uncharacterized protein n=1 Tax=Glossina pallidipes TaxID=7398 RepID=A0A1A9ZGK3_GLOPL
MIERITEETPAGCLNRNRLQVLWITNVASVKSNRGRKKFEIQPQNDSKQVVSHPAAVKYAVAAAPAPAVVKYAAPAVTYAAAAPAVVKYAAPAVTYAAAAPAVTYAAAAPAVSYHAAPAVAYHAAPAVTYAASPAVAYSYGGYGKH